MKKIGILITAMLLPLFAIAQNYSKLWDEVEQAQNKDLPKTALSGVNKIISLANSNGNSDQLAKALIVKMCLVNQLSPDSAETMLPIVEKECKNRKTALDRCVYSALLGWLYNCRTTDRDPQTKNKAIQAFTEATSNPAALATAKTDGYMALLTKGEDSNYYNHDMLSVIFPFVANQLDDMRVPEAKPLARTIMGKEIDWYKTHNMREATMLAKIDSVSILDYGSRSFFEEIVKEYGDLSVSTKAYAWLCDRYTDKDAYLLAKDVLKRHPRTKYTNTIKNVLNKIEQPRLSIYTDANDTYPGDKVNLIYNYQNTKNATLSYYRLPFATSDTAWIKLKAKDYIKYAKKADFTQQLPIRHGEPYDKFKDTINFTVPNPGIYLVEVGGSDYDNSYTIVYVSRLAVMQLPLPEQKLRICVVDYKNGKPVPYSTIKLRNVYQDTVRWQQHITDARGEVVLPNFKGNTEIFASTEDDKALTPTGMTYSRDYNWNRHDRNIFTELYTDRAIYRPGQQVKIGGFFYEKDDDSTCVIPEHPLDLTIRDVNNKNLQTITVVTDEFGSFCAEFTLPQECLNGRFSIRCNMNGSTTFKVEEYKRPKFKVTIDKPTDAYVLGDTITVTGQVMTYSGLPLENTTVYCSNERRKTWWFRYYDKDEPLTVRDTVKTDADGKFSIPVVLSVPKASDDSYWRPLCYSYNISAKATADDGETEEGSLLITAGNTKTFVQTNIPSVICKEKMPNLTVTQNNAMGEAVDGEGNYYLICNKDTVRTGTLLFNKPDQLDFIAQLPSGEYKLTVLPTGETKLYYGHNAYFTILSLNDTKPLGTKPLRVWHSSDEFSYTEPVDILIATPLKDMWLRYDIMANEQLRESHVVQISDTVMHLRLNWKEEYGRGAYIIFALYNEGNLHTDAFTLIKPLPDKDLQLQWSTFRDKLQPGSAERWTLRVLKQDKPVEASVLATMYDASLDKFGKHALPFSLSFDRYVPEMRWNSTYNRKFYDNLIKGYERLSEESFDFTELDNNLLDNNPFYYYGRIMRLGAGLNESGRVLREVAMPMAKSAHLNRRADDMMLEEQAAAMVDDDAVEEEQDITGDVEMRSNFNETAYFTSTLRTDTKGEATIEFTLPESLTSWNFKALAHTCDVSYGFLDNVIIVQKPLMVQANMPRFLRSGDETSLAVTIRNNSDQPQSGKAQLVLIDAQTGQQVKLITNKFAIEPGKTENIDFPFSVSGDQSMLICRYAALTDEFSDGEQQYLPVISDLQKTVSTVPFMINDGQTHTFPLDSLKYNPKATHSLLTIEYTGNPAWTAISALPSTVNYQTKCATQLAINYNALTLMRQIIARNPQLADAIRDWKQQDSVPAFFAQLQKNPELKIVALQNTPWVGDADHERGRLESLMQDDQTLSLKQASMLHKLKDMQTAEGGWQWFPGMPASTWLTIDIAEMLGNTRALCPDAADDIDKLLTPAMRFLDSKAVEEVAYIKKYKTKYVPTTWMRYLYTRSLYTNNFVNTKATKYLVKRLQKSSRSYNLYDKAMAASILQRAARTKQANLTLKSLMEYTVSTPEMGRYFDSERAPRTWSMYKVPTQVAAIDALQLIKPDDKQTLNEMRLWLLQSKHTQMWDEPLAATKAIGCLLSDGMLAAPTALPSQLDLNLTTREVIPIQEYANIEPFVQAGYIKAAFSDSLLAATPQSLTVRQSAATVEQTLSYGAAYLQSWLPAIETPAAGSELRLTCQLYKETAGGWQLLSPTIRVKKGDRIMVRYDIDADRDFDFVALRDGRPACLEPTSTASGYEWKNGCYRSVEDDGTIWYFDTFRKGHHVIEETYDVDRLGHFTSACPQVQCQYAPEFSARARAITL
ncbi:MAG: hypothetical protein J5593_00860, partial [Bacteroidaceae bacterium]|nr:hypothetical protein [Bacteroidaceae bacterium]